MTSYELLPLAAFVINVALFAWILLLKRKSPLHRVFSAFLLSMALWGLSIYAMRTSPDLSGALAWDKAVLPVLAAIVVFFLHFTYLYTGFKPRKRLLASAYLLPILGGVLYPTHLLVHGMKHRFYGYAPEAGILFPPYLLALHVVVLLGLVNLVRAHRLSRSEDERERLRYMILGIASSIIGGITDYIAAAGLPMYPLGIPGNILFGLLTTVAIVHLRLLDVVLAFRKGIVYSIISAVLLATYGGGVVLLNQFLQGIATTASFVLNILLVLLVAVALHPILRWSQSLVDRWFYRGRYDHLRALERFGLETKDLTDLQQLASSLIKLITLAMKARAVHLLLPDRARDNFELVASTDGTQPGGAILSSASPLLAWFAVRPNVLLAASPADLPFASSLPPEERATLDALKGEIYVPLKTQGELSGLLIVGRKASGHPYSDEDIGLLQTVAHQASTAIRNSQLFAEAEARAGEARQSERRYKNLLERANDAIFLIGTDTLRIVDANQQALALTGYTTNELLSLDAVALHMPEERERAAEIWSRTVG
ncbi:MAG: GAF domain-containing protein, partial [Chloroflexi bacterium]|nr:GAF domain-containing protein [Chloroflexota bacterium]